jgi:hypothetical protein
MNLTHYPEVETLITAPEIDSAAWDVVAGRVKKEYYCQSPFATITAYTRGFVVENLVTGGKHPVARWDQAISLRAQIAQRYQTIATRAGW